MTLQITRDIMSIVRQVTGTKPRKTTNKKGTTFERRYKVSGLGQVSQSELTQIDTQICQKYPDRKFSVKNIVQENQFLTANGLSGIGLVVRVM